MPLAVRENVPVVPYWFLDERIFLNNDLALCNRHLKCDLVQGYYFYKPMTDNEIESILIEMATLNT